MERIHITNVIWSDCIIIESEGKFGLIDTSQNIRLHTVIPYVESLGIKEFEFMVITHFHRDHFEGATHFLENYKFKKVYIKKYSGLDGSDGSGKTATEEYHENTMKQCEQIIELAKQKSEVEIITLVTNSVSVGNFDFKLFRQDDYLRKAYNDNRFPYYQVKKYSENYNSIALFAKVNGKNVYLAGDLTDNAHEIPYFNYVNTQIAEQIGEEIDIYKVPHHGTSHCNSSRTLEILNPKYSVITNSTEYLDKYTTLDDFNKANPDMKVLITENHHVVFTISKDGNITYELKD